MSIVSVCYNARLLSIGARTDSRQLSLLHRREPDWKIRGVGGVEPDKRGTHNSQRISLISQAQICKSVCSGYYFPPFSYVPILFCQSRKSSLKLWLVLLVLYGLVLLAYSAIDFFVLQSTTQHCDFAF